LGEPGLIVDSAIETYRGGELYDRKAAMASDLLQINFLSVVPGAKIHVLCIRKKVTLRAIDAGNPFRVSSLSPHQAEIYRDWSRWISGFDGRISLSYETSKHCSWFSAVNFSSC
jgi:hypothetical protein